MNIQPLMACVTSGRRVLKHVTCVHSQRILPSGMEGGDLHSVSAPKKLGLLLRLGRHRIWGTSFKEIGIFSIYVSNQR